MAWSLPRRARFDARLIVTIAAVFVFVIGTLLDIPPVDHAPHDAGHEIVQVQVGPIQALIGAVTRSHCRQNVSCHAAVMPATAFVPKAPVARLSFPMTADIAELKLPSDLSRPPARA